MQLHAEQGSCLWGSRPQLLQALGTALPARPASARGGQLTGQRLLHFWRGFEYEKEKTPATPHPRHSQQSIGEQKSFDKIRWERPAAKLFKNKFTTNHGEIEEHIFDLYINKFPW